VDRCNIPSPDGCVSTEGGLSIEQRWMGGAARLAMARAKGEGEKSFVPVHPWSVHTAVGGKEHCASEM